MQNLSASGYQTDYSGKDFHELSKQITQTIEGIDKKLTQIVDIPFYKKAYFKLFKKAQHQVLHESLKYFEEKKAELYTSRDSLLQLEQWLTEENKRLKSAISAQKRKKNRDNELLVQLETKYIINTDITQTQIPIVNELIGNTVMKMEKVIPIIHQTLKNSMTINTTLKLLTLVIDKMIELEKYSKELEKENYKIIDRLVGNATEQIINSIDIDYYKDMQKRNEALNRKFSESKAKYMKKMEKLEKELSGIIEINENKTNLLNAKRG